MTISKGDKDFLKWFSGFFDGEGCIHSSYPNRRKRKPSLSVNVGNTDKKIMEFIYRNLGGKGGEGKFYLQHIRNDKCKPIYRIRWSGNYAQNLLLKLKPYIILKRKQLIVALRFNFLPSNSGGTKLSSKEKQKRIGLAKQLRGLNFRNRRYHGKTKS